MLGRWLSGIRYLWAGPDILLQSHVRSIANPLSRSCLKVLQKEKPYAIRTPETYFVHFSSETHIKQLVDAPEELLSLHALSKDVCVIPYVFQKQVSNSQEHVPDVLARIDDEWFGS